MTKLVTLTVERGRAHLGDIGDALRAPSLEPAANILFTDKAGKTFCLPDYVSAAQAAGGTQAFATTVAEDGRFSFFLKTRPPAISGSSAYTQGVSFALVLDATAVGTRFPLQQTQQGDVWTLTAKLAGDDLIRARAALFETNPNVAIEVTQPVRVAIQQTQAFIYAYWSKPEVQQGLIALFHIPFSSASSYYNMASSADTAFPNQYLVLHCTYQTQIQAPGLPGYIQLQVNWENRAYNYYQDNQDRTRVFYLPDRFEFAKGPANSPTISLLQFSIPQGDVSVANTRATFRLFGNPIVENSRIQEAAKALAEKIGRTPQMASLQDAHNVKSSFVQYLPNEKATGSNPTEQPSASINLNTGLRAELDLNFDQFRALWAAIFSEESENPIFRGWVDVDLSDGKYTDRIDFNGRLPKDKAKSFFDDILDTSTSNSYSTTINVQTFAKVFQSTPAVIAIEIRIGSNTVTLSPSSLAADLKVERSIRDIVVNEQDLSGYSGRIRVVREDGTTCTSVTVKTDDPKLWLTSDVVASATGPCT